MTKEGLEGTIYKDIKYSQGKSCYVNAQIQVNALNVISLIIFYGPCFSSVLTMSEVLTV